MAFLAGIEYWEQSEGSGLYERDREGGSWASDRWKCRWEDRTELATRLMGGSFIDGAGNRVDAPRMRHPDHPHLYCAGVSISPWGRPKGLRTWDWAMLDIVWSTFPFGPSGDDSDILLEEELEIGGEVVSAGAEGWKDGDGKPIQNPVSISVPHMVWVLTQHRVPTVPSDVIRALFNRLNSAPFKGHATGHVLYLGATARRATTTAGAQDWTVVHRFAAADRDMREHFDGGKWKMIQDADGNHKYATGDFSQLGL